MQTAPAELKLVDGGEEIIVRPARPSHASPVLCREWNPGAPAVREVTTDLIGADGVLDSSVFSGARSVVLDLQIFGSPYETPYSIVERLCAMAHPTRRPYLYVTRSDGETWQLLLRGTEFSVGYGARAATMLELQLSFVAPYGLFESPLREVSSNSVAARGLGQVWPVTWPEDYGHSGGAGNPLVMEINSSTPVEPTMRIYGPTTGPAIVVDTGEQFVFESDYTIADGQYVEIDMRNGTVLLNGDAGSSIFNRVDWTKSAFFRLGSGPTAVMLVATGGLLTINWRDRRLTA